MMSGYTHTYRVSWSHEDGEYLGVCDEFPSLSWLAETHEDALAGIRILAEEVAADIQSNCEPIPEQLAE